MRFRIAEARRNDKILAVRASVIKHSNEMQRIRLTPWWNSGINVQSRDFGRTRYDNQQA